MMSADESVFKWHSHSGIYIFFGSKMHSFVKQDKKAWLSYADGKSLSLCMP
jgi:hypothetical protein